MDYISYIKKSKKYETLIFKALDGRTCNSGIREKIVAGYLALSTQHHCSIIALIENQLYSSAYALLRPIIEAVYRGTWLTFVASDEDIEHFTTGLGFKFNPTWKLAKEIDEVIEGETFHTVYNSNAPLLNGMTHGGIEQIGKQFGEDGNFIELNFEDQDVSELLKVSNANVGVILLSYSLFQKDKELTKLAKDIISGKI